MSDNQIIKVQNLAKQYRKSKTNAVDDVSFYVNEGAFFSLLGPNGAGKTTIISILTTTLSKTAGEVSVAGYDIDKQASQVRSSIGVIFQNPSLDINLTAEENIRFHSNLYGLYPYNPSFKMMPLEYQQRVTDLAKVLGLEADVFKPVKTLSGGMKRKLEIIRSLMHKPKVLFLDEPTQGLDPISRASLWGYLQEIRRQEKITIFLTTHYLEEAEHSDYICIINHGQIRAQGTPAEIKQVLLEKYIVVDAADRSVLKSELTQKQIPFSGEGPLRLDLDDTSIQDLIKQIQTPLSRIDIYNPSLEQAYVKIIQERDQHE